MLPTETPDSRRHEAGIGAYDLAAAMREYGVPYGLALAPAKLGADRGVPDQPVPPPSHQRAFHPCAIADVERDAMERLPAIADRDDIRHVEQADPTASNAIADRRRMNGMLDRKRLESEVGEGEGPAHPDDASIDDGIMTDQCPGLRGRVHRARRAFSEPACMVRMPVREYDRGRLKVCEMTEPVGAAVEHEAKLPMLDQKGAVPSVASGAPFDLAARSQESQAERQSGVGALFSNASHARPSLGPRPALMDVKGGAP
jgi:hypothetical protein